MTAHSSADLDRDTIESAIRTELSSILGEESLIDSATPLRLIDLDSLGFIELVAGVEARLGALGHIVHLDDARYSNDIAIADLVEIILGKDAPVTAGLE